MNDQEKLTLKLSVTFSAAIGYGYAYKSKVLEVIDGELSQDEFVFTILAEDEKNFKFISAHSAPAEVVAVFAKLNENVPNSMMPITGFVDNDKTSWEVISLKPYN